MLNDDEKKIQLINDEDKKNEKDDGDTYIVVDLDKSNKKEEDSFSFDDFDDDEEEEKKNIEDKDNNINKDIPKGNVLDKTAQDKLLLIDMGFEKLLVERIYSKVFPTNIEEALDYLNKDDKNKFTHSYIADNNLSLCSICGKARSEHAGELLLIERERERER